MQGKIVRLFKHLQVITRHKYYVAKYCFKFHLYYRGIFHDMSKYSSAELFPSAHYFTGSMSPQVRERQDYDGYSYMSVHHCCRNSHHYQYHVDFTESKILVIAMPYKDVIEMVCDSLAASIVYAGKENYNRTIPYAYFKEHMNGYAMHPATKAFLLYVFKEYELNDFKNLKNSILTNKYQEFINMYSKVFQIPLELDALKPKED